MIFEISLGTKKHTSDIFNAFAAAPDYTFNKTKILVKLYMEGGTIYVSRSQAGRLLSRLENLK